jgi:hypothetical protein
MAGTCTPAGQKRARTAPLKPKSGLNGPRSESMWGPHGGAQMKLYLVLTVLLLVFVLGCGEKGQARASVKELIGSYETEFKNGKERITLNSDKTFSQVFFSSQGQITTHGKWEASNEFLGGTEVLLVGNYASEDRPPGSPPVYGERTLIVHKEHGNLKLAFNEAADWYYDRVQ